MLFLTLQGLLNFENKDAKEISLDIIQKVVCTQKRNGNFGNPNDIEKVSIFMQAIKELNL